MDAKRPMSVTIAAVLLAMFCVAIDVSFPLWADMIQRDDGGAPAAIVYFTVAVGVAGLVAAAVVAAFASIVVLVFLPASRRAYASPS